MINIINAKLLQISDEKAISNIKDLRQTGKVIVICPDRMALLVENKIFDTLKVSSLFDCDVMTMSRLTNKILQKQGNTKKILSKQLAITIIKKILLENQFSSFKDVVNFNGFATKLFEIISLFKSCKLTPLDLLNNTSNIVLKEKLEDLNIIYTNYEKFLQSDYTDSFNRLDLFCNSVTDEFKDTHIIMVGYTDFTKQMLSIIKMFECKAKSVTISTSSSYGYKELNNNNLFVNNVFLGLIELCKSNGIIYHIDNVKEELDSLKTFLINNLYTYHNNTYPNDVNQINLAMFSNSDNELEFVLKDIKYKVIKNKLRYGMFSILCPNLNGRKLELKSQFEKYDIPYFLDASSTLNESNIALFVLSILECVENNFRKEEFLNLLKNIYSKVNSTTLSQFEDYLSLNGIDYVTKESLKDFKDIKTLYECMCTLKSEDMRNVQFYIDNLNNIFNALNINLTNSEVIDNLNRNNKIDDSYSYKLALEKVVEALQELNSMLKDYTLTLSNFYNIVKCYFENVVITIPPVLSDVVMVYDTNNSFVDTNDYVYMLSCVEGLVPLTISDVSLVSDAEIGLFNEELRLSPTCNLINKRNKFKLFENLFKFNKKLTLTYYTSTSGEKALSSSFVTNITKLLPKLNIIDGDKYISNYDYFKESNNLNIFELNNISSYSAYKNFINMTKIFDNYFQSNFNNFNKYYFSLLDALPDKTLSTKILERHNFKNKKPKLNNPAKLFNNNTTSVSQIETYYNCPYKHFVRYGLRPKEKLTNTLRPNDIGSIIHEFASVIFPQLKGVNSDGDLEILTNKVLDTILNEKFGAYLNASNSHIIKSLYEEAFRVAKSILLQQSNSQFKNSDNELFFNHIKELSVTVDGVTIYVLGFIDRIDKCDDMFSLIDYKTGADQFDYTDLKSGKKIQLMIYVKAVKSMMDLQPVCACYLPIKNDFAVEKSNINSYKFKGVFTNSISDLQKLDINYADKNLSSLGIKFTNETTIDSQSVKYTLSSEQILKLADIAFDLVIKAVKEIMEGNIDVYPLYDGESACSRCSYSNICNFNTLYKNKYRIVDKVSSFDELTAEEPKKE